MIIYNPASSILFGEFGILVPHADRPGAVLRALQADPRLAGQEEQWLRQGPLPDIGPDDLRRAHTEGYVRRLYEDPEPAMLAAYELVNPDGSLNRYDPARATRSLAELRDRALANAAGSCLAAELATEHGFAFYLGGGQHHAMPDFGNGFCPVNDIVVAIRRLQARRAIQRAWIIDLDAHKGDGSAAMCLDDPTIRTLSIHMAHGWPLDRPAREPGGALHPSFLPSDLDLPIEPGAEAYYIPTLAAGLKLLLTLDQGRLPDLAFVVDGSDPYEFDELPSARALQLSLDQMTARDRLVYSFFQAHNTPQAWVMAGGYGARCAEVYARFLSMTLAERLA